MQETHAQQIERFSKQAMEFARRATVAQEIRQEKEFTADDAEYQRFLQKHTGQGTLKVQTTAARGLIPVEGADVEIFASLPSGMRLIRKGVTDGTGILDEILLPAVQREAEMTPQTAEESATEYLVTAKHPDYTEQPMQKILIFDQIRTILPVWLYPKETIS